MKFEEQIILRSVENQYLTGSVDIVILWQLDLQLPVQSVHITPKVREADQHLIFLSILILLDY